MYRIAKIVSTLSCVVLLLVAGMWIRSYWVLDRYSCQSHDGYDWKLRSEIGRFSFWRVSTISPKFIRPSMWVSHEVPDDALPATMMSECAGFLLETSGPLLGRDARAFSRFFLIVPYWALASFAAAAPVMRLGLHQRRQRRLRLPTMPVQS